MKTVNKNSVAKNDLFSKHSKVALSAQQQQMIKGGEGEVIIIEDLIDA